jgi:uncharacterized membrane protein
MYIDWPGLAWFIGFVVITVVAAWQHDRVTRDRHRK